MADQPLPFRRCLSANFVALLPSGVALGTLYWTGLLAPPGAQQACQGSGPYAAGRHAATLRILAIYFKAS